MKHSFLRPAIGAGLIALALTLGMCKKNPTTCHEPEAKDKPTVNAQGLIDKPGRVKNPEYKLSDKQAYDAVMAFKQLVGSDAQARGGPDSLQLDSALYLIESSINYDYDYPPKVDFLELSEDVSSYNFMAGGSEADRYISNAVVNDVNTALHNRYDALMASGAVLMAIDVEAFIDDASTGQGHFEVSASVANINIQPFRCNTSPWNPNVNYSGASWSYISGLFNCGAATWPAGLTGADVTFQKGLNCRDLYYNGCANGYWFPVVNTVTKISSGLNDPYLYECQGTSVYNYCTGNSIITKPGSYFNTKLAATRSYIPAYINSMWPGQTFVDNSALIFNQNTVSTSGTVIYWLLKYQRGVRNCRPIPHW